MKKVLTKILVTIFVLIIGYQQFSYADVVVIDSAFYFAPIAFLAGFIGVIVLVISAISFFSLKMTVKKQNMVDYDREKLAILNKEEIEKKKNRIQRRFYIWGMILSIIVIIYLDLIEEFSIFNFVLPIILFVASIIIRLNKNKKLSNIMCAVSVVLVCIIAIWTGISNKIIENYNNQFLQYKEGGYGYDNYYVDIKGLINTAIENNKSGRKVTLIYKDVKYTSVDELEQLLSNFNTRKKCLMRIEYNNGYIESITLNRYIYDFQKYEGEQKKGALVKSLIQDALYKVENYEKLIITYINQTTTIEVDANNSDEMSNLMKQISSTEKYDVEVQGNSDSCNIIIISNN